MKTVIRVVTALVVGAATNYFVYWVGFGLLLIPFPGLLSSTPARIVGPIVFTPQANQGPLLGIFITGPLGFLLGGIGGFVYWMRRRSVSRQPRSS